MIRGLRIGLVYYNISLCFKGKLAVPMGLLFPSTFCFGGGGASFVIFRRKNSKEIHVHFEFMGN
jgi:hypothetical protein